MNEPERSTKGQILLILKKRGKLSIADLARELAITPMGVRQHLSVLERDGLVATKMMRKPMGRPIYLYYLTAKADPMFPKRFEEFAVSLMEGITAIHGEEALEGILRERFQRIAERYRLRFLHKNLEKQVEEMQRVFLEMGYLAEVEKVSNKIFALINYNCPINSIAHHYPSICRWELECCRTLLTAKVDRIDDLARGGLNCSYIIQGNKPLSFPLDPPKEEIVGQ